MIAWMLGMSEKEESDVPNFLAAVARGPMGPLWIQSTQAFSHGSALLPWGKPPASEVAVPPQYDPFPFLLPKTCTWALFIAKVLVQVLSGDEAPGPWSSESDAGAQPVPCSLQAKPSWLPECPLSLLCLVGALALKNHL